MKNNVILDLKIPEDGSSHKYISGTTEDGQEVIIARPQSTHYYHKDIVNSFPNKLTDIRGGWIRKKKGLYLVDGSSGAYGKANHRRVSKIINGNSFEIQLRVAKENLVERLKDDWLETRLDPGYLIGTIQGALNIGAFVSTGIYAAALGYAGITPDLSTPGMVCQSAVILAGVGSTFIPGNHPYIKTSSKVESAAEIVATNLFYLPFMYGVGNLISKLT